MAGSLSASRNERQGAFPIQCRGQLREDREVRVKPHTLDPAHPEWREAPFVLQPAEASLDGRTAPVEALPAQRLARDQGVEAVGLDPDGCRRALARRAAPLAGPALMVGSGEPP